MDPAHQGCMVYEDAAVAHHFDKVTITDVVPQIVPYSKDDHRFIELAAFKMISHLKSSMSFSQA